MSDEETIARMKEIRELLDEFGLVLAGYDPGVSAYVKGQSERGNGYWGEPINFDRQEWKWLEPLLKELRDARFRLNSVVT